MMLFRTILIWAVQALLFCVGIGVAGLSAHLFGPIMGETFGIDELIPTALIFFAAAAALGWIGNRFLPESWTYDNPLL